MLFDFARKPIWPGVDKDFCRMLCKVMGDEVQIRTIERSERNLWINKIQYTGDTESLNLNK